MAQFRYRAKDTEKGTISGVVEAESTTSAASKVRELGYWPMDIVEVPPGQAPMSGKRKPASYEIPTAPKRPYLSRIPAAQMTIFWRQFGTMLNSGMSILQAIGLLGQHSQGLKLRTVARDIHRSISNGSSFGEALARHTEAFAPAHILLIQAGEQGGQLEKMANAIADDLDREISMRRRISLMLIYPIILVLAMIFLPNLKELIIGRTDVYIRQTMTTLGWIVGTIALIFFGGRAMLLNAGIARTFDEIKLALPGVGKVVRNLAVARFCRTLGDLYSAGVPIIRATVAATSSCGNQAMTNRLAEHISLLENGGRITEVMRRSGVFSSMVLSMAATGETTGDVNTMLSKVADHLEDEAQAGITALMVVGGVLIILIIGLIIAFQVIGFYTGYSSNLVGRQGM